MKKAKEYARIIIEDNYSEKSTKNTILELCNEIGELIKQRKIKRPQAAAAVVSEICDKWNSICRKVNKSFGNELLREGGFKEFLKKRIGEEAPELLGFI